MMKVYTDGVGSRMITAGLVRPLLVIVPADTHVAGKGL
jgi:hypothetical protein